MTLNPGGFANKLTHLVERLIADTENDLIEWTQTVADEQMWDCNLKDSTARVFARDHDETYPFALYLFGPGGTVVLKLDTNEEMHGVAPESLKRLHDIVARRDSGVETVVDSMLAELNRIEEPPS